MTDSDAPSAGDEPVDRATLAAAGREITDVARRDPDRPAIITGGAVTTFADLERNVERLAAVIAARLEPGDVLALVCTNRPEWLVAYQAALRAGVTLLPVNWHLEAEDMAYVVTDSGAVGILAESRFASVLAGVPVLDLQVSIGGAIDGYTPWADALAAAPGPSPVRARGTQMIYTSGSTGRPKGVRHDPTPSATAVAIGEAMVAMFGMDGDGGDTMLAPAPLYHSGPQRLCCEWPLGAGVGVVLMDRFDAERALALIDEHRISHAFFVPTMFQRMLAVPDRQRYDVSSLRFVLHGAGPCTVATKQAMFDWFGPVIHEIYASSEGPGTWITPQEWLAHPGSVGRIDPTRLQIRRDDGTVADVDEEGTVWSFSTTRFRYHDDPDKTATTYDESDEWYTVGDRGRLDADGYLYLTGRTAECIVSGGVNLYPARVDEALADAPGIVDGAAFGIPDEEMGEVLVVAVVPLSTPPPADLATAVVDHCRARVGAQLAPRQVFLVDELPRSDAGKLYRRRLVDRFAR